MAIMKSMLRRSIASTSVHFAPGPNSQCILVALHLIFFKFIPSLVPWLRVCSWESKSENKWGEMHWKTTKEV